MFTLKSLRVRNFRGFRDTDAGNFDFDRPITILFGQNGRGKSSTLNAVEWGLFGSECSGKETNIRERVGWIVANQHANSGKVSVELEIQDNDGTYLVRRELQSRRKKSDGDVEIKMPDGKRLTGTQAAPFLANHLLCSTTFRDFATTVYQHQEVIRAIVTEEPRHRNDAIDRLLGLSDYHNLQSSLQAAKAKRRQEDFLGELRNFEIQVETARRTHENILEGRRNEARDAGVPSNKLNAKAVLAIARDFTQALDHFATETGLESVPLQVPQDWPALKSFCEAMRIAINRYRGEIPAASEQEKLLERRGKVIGLKSDLGSAKREQNEIGNRIRELDKEYGGQNSVDGQLAKVKEKIEDEEIRLHATNARAALIRQAIKFLEAEEEKGSLSDCCPVCGNEAPALLETLHQLWEERLQAKAGEIDAKIKLLEKKAKTLQSAADDYKDWNDRLKKVMEKLENCRRNAGALLEREFGAEDEPLPLLDIEADRIKKRLQELSTAVLEKQTRLSAIEAELENVKIIHQILLLEKRREIIEQIQQSTEYEEVETCRDVTAALVEDLEQIRAAISEVMNEEARGKLDDAETAIDCYFRRLTNHLAVRAIKLKVEPNTRTQRNDYAITDQDDKDLTPILSQGDLNALALAIFLGLAASTKDSGAFGFVLMDDPSQSLDSEHKKQLVQVLNDVASQKQLVISTMDEEFRDCLAAELTKTKRQYVFEAWTPEEGPTITRM